MKKDEGWEEVEDIDEASTAAGVKGFQMPIGAKGKKKNNPSKPYGEPEVYEMKERVEKRGDQWVVIDPRTGAQRGQAASRDQARELQRQLGITTPRNPSKLTEPPKKQKKKPAHYRRPQHKAKVAENLKEFLRGIKQAGFELTPINESSMISYIYDEGNGQQPIWEGFLNTLPKSAVMSDRGLAEMLKAMALAEARVLAKSVMEIKKVLEGTGKFVVERLEADQDPQTGDVRMPFKVMFGEGHSLVFGVRMEGYKPLILFPEESRKALNDMVTQESKLLRAELMHVQETALDSISDVVEASLQRDRYLSEMQKRLRETLGGMSLVEVSILKSLVKERLKGVK